MDCFAALAMTESADAGAMSSSKAVMSLPATFVIDTPGDAARAAELRRVKLLATSVLAATFAIFLGAKALLPVHPAFGFIAAFAEAATIGGLADWYAVVALFKRPLGLPIPHTAIIQSNQQRIADKLGEFIEVHFLESAPVEAKLRQIDFGSFIADWLRDRKRSEDLARFALRLLPEAVAATENSGLMTFVSRRITAQLMSIDLAPLAAGTLRAFVKEGRHQGLLDDLLRGGASDDDAGRDHGHDPREDPRRIADAAEALSRRQVSGEQDRGVGQRLLRGSPQRSRASVPRRVRPHGADLRRPARHRSGLCRAHPGPEARSAGAPRTDGPCAPHLGRMRASFFERSASGETQVLEQYLVRMFVTAGEALAGDAELRTEINQGLVAVLRTVVAEQKSGVSTFISDQVKSWDMGQLISLIEINIGRDLQYIRFNGSLIGGLAGLALYTLEYLLRLL